MRCSQASESGLPRAHRFRFTQTRRGADTSAPDECVLTSRRSSGPSHIASEDRMCSKP